ncbi:MAG: peptide deformylase [Leptolyngbya sp. SIO3F4]|nr:peptide deformylase [Leptolyngbya sp. SIO3F4]
MSARQIVLLGNPSLYEFSEEVREKELESLKPVVADLHDTLMAFRKQWGAGRAVAAPQIGVMKRLIYMHIDSPVVFINPYLEEQSEEMFDVWDDCMSFPDLLVKVPRHRSCRVVYRDMDWQLQSINLESDLSELLQHEIDHLDGILNISRAVDKTAFALRSQAKFTDYDRSDLPEAV